MQPNEYSDIGVMKATEINLLKFLKQPNQFVIPIYQRTYSWTEQQCQQLWQDVKRLAVIDEESGHFVGSIVYIEAGLYQVASVPQLLVIDGQQRLTTMSLILMALAKAIAASEQPCEITRRKIENYFLFNNEEEGDDRFKLLLTQGDRKTFIRLIEDRELPKDPAKRIVENFQYFETQIRKSDLDLNALYRGISKLIIVNIALDRDRDNPQLIFESLNSTGLDLSQADLIRNYVLMGLEPKKQSKVYQHYWYPMEESFDADQTTRRFDGFMRDYLTLKSKSGVIPKQSEVYNSFKTYLQGQTDISVSDLIADVYRYSKHYVKFALDQEPEITLRKAFQDLKTLKVDVSYPFLLEVYDDYESGVISKEAFVQLVRLIESYVFRRLICGVATNSLNKTFATLGREIDRENYLESIQFAFARKDSYRRFPDDQEFHREFVVKDIYQLRNRIYVFRKLENYKRTKELVDPENYTIEHILPQNPKLSEQWQEDLGANWQELQAQYLHTIGNLTLTGYNSEYSDRPFLQKRDMEGGFAVSPLMLNQDLAQLERWTESEINDRAMMLAQWATDIWNYPQVSLDQHNSEELAEEVNKRRHEEYLQGEIGDLFEAFRRRVLNLDPSVREEYKKLYIAYKNTTNFVDVIPQRSKLRLSLNMRFDEIDDPLGLCRDISDLGRWGNGDVDLNLSNSKQLDDVMTLVQQSFDKHSDFSE